MPPMVFEVLLVLWLCDVRRSVATRTMFHAGVISLEKCCSPRQYDASALIHLLMEIEPQKQIIGTQKDAVGLPLFAFN